MKCEDGLGLYMDMNYLCNNYAHPLPGEMNISQLQGKIEFNTFFF